MPASTLRRIHAALLNMAVLGLPFYWIGLAVPISLLILTLLCIFVPIGLSPGHWILGIQPDRTVDDEILSGESWLTLLMGFLFVEWGASTAVYWTQFDKLPLFGVLLDPALGAAISTSWGLLTILAGILFYKLSPVGLWLGIGIVILNAADLFVSRTAWIDIHMTRVIAAQPPDSPFQGGTFSAESISYELTPFIGGILGVGSAGAIILMMLGARRLTRTG